MRFQVFPHSSLRSQRDGLTSFQSLARESMSGRKETKSLFWYDRATRSG